MARWPTPKVVVNDPAAPQYNPDDPNRDKIGIYAEDFHDLAEVLVNKKDPNYWDSQKMTKRSIYPESVFAYEGLIAGEEWNDLDNDHANWTAGNDTAISTDTSNQVEGDGCLKLTGTSQAISATRTFTQEDWSAYNKVILLIRANSNNEVVTIRLGTNSSNYWQFKTVCPVANRWYQVELELSGSGYGMPPESTVGSPNVAQIGYIAVFGTATASPVLWLDLITLHSVKNTKRVTYNPYAQPRGVIPLMVFSGHGTNIGSEDASATQVTVTVSTANVPFKSVVELAALQSARCRLIVRARVGGSYTGYIQLYVNGQAVGPQLSTTSTSYVNLDTGWIRLPNIVGGLITVEVRGWVSSSGTLYISSMQLYTTR